MQIVVNMHFEKTETYIIRNGDLPHSAYFKIDTLYFAVLITMHRNRVGALMSVHQMYLIDAMSCALS